MSDTKAKIAYREQLTDEESNNEKTRSVYSKILEYIILKFGENRVRYLDNFDRIKFISSNDISSIKLILKYVNCSSMSTLEYTQMLDFLLRKAEIDYLSKYKIKPNGKLEVLSGVTTKRELPKYSIWLYDDYDTCVSMACLKSKCIMPLPIYEYIVDRADLLFDGGNIKLYGYDEDITDRKINGDDLPVSKLSDIGE